MYRTKTTPDPVFTDVLKLELASVEPSLAGPKRPQDRVAAQGGQERLRRRRWTRNSARPARWTSACRSRAASTTLGHGDVVIAAITSCTNTSNPSVMIAAGLLARKAVAKGLTVKPWVKTSLAPGSQVVAEYLEKSGLQKDLDELGFNLVGFGCTTCIGNSGPLPAEISKAINDNDLVAAAVLSGNRNFEGRVNADVRANYLASPPLVVAYALAGSMQIDVAKAPLGTDQKGRKVYLRDIWPTSREIADVIRKNINKQMFTRKYGDVFKGDAQLAQDRGARAALTYPWDRNRPTCRTRPISTAWRSAAGADRPTSSTRASSACSSIRSPPTTSRRPARSRRTRPAGKYLRRSPGRAASTSTSTARGAAITK